MQDKITKLAALGVLLEVASTSRPAGPLRGSVAVLFRDLLRKGLGAEQLARRMKIPPEEIARLCIRVIRAS